jgi:hypothetical protein
LFVTTAESAQAQGYAQSKGVTIRKDALEKVQWYKAPLQIQILNAGPIVTDHRTAPAEPESFTIPIGPVGGGKSVVGGGSTIPAGGIRIGNPQAVRLVNNGLPKAQLGSNINESRLKPGRLPSGKSTNLLAGHPVKQKPGLIAHAGKQEVGTGPVAAVQPETRVFKYPNQGGVSASGGLSTSTSVSAVLKQRGSLLGK